MKNKLFCIVASMLLMSCSKESDALVTNDCKPVTSTAYHYDAKHNLTSSHISFYRWKYCGEELNRMISRTDTICEADGGYLVLTYKIDSDVNF